MTIAARGLAGYAVSLVVLAAVSLATPALAQAPQKSLQDELVGHWDLKSVTVHNLMSYGDRPQGSMFFSAGGSFSVIVITSGSARSIAYFGTYTVDDAASSIALHVENSTGGSGISAAGRDETRRVTLDGDELTEQNMTPTGPGGFKLTWRRGR